MTGAPWEPPLAGSEEAQLIGALERLRTTFRWKADGLAHRTAKSSLTLGGLLKHLALVEDHQFGAKYDGMPFGEPWAAVDWDADPDWEFRTAADDSPESMYALWDDAVERSRQRVAAALAKDGGLDQRVAAGGDARHASLRRLVCDMLEEYGRHTGHADMLREAVDGVAGRTPGRVAAEVGTLAATRRSRLSAGAPLAGRQTDRQLPPAQLPFSGRKNAISINT